MCWGGARFLLFLTIGPLSISRKVLPSVVPPTEAIIMDEYGQRLDGVVGPFNEGYPLSLICEGEGGDPPPEVTWWKGSLMIDDSYTLTPQHFSRNVLHIPALRREDLLIILTCQAANSNSSSPVTSSVTLDMNLRPLDVKIYTPRKPISVNQEMQLECQSRGARPPAQITWWKGSEKLTSVTETTVREENLTISILDYVPSASDNGLNLTCQADNPQVRDSEIQDAFYLDVYYSPQVTISNNVKNFIVEKSDVTFTCNIQANPPVTKVDWVFNDGYLMDNPSKGIIIHKHSLRVSPVDKRHQGHYRCEVENSQGRTGSDDLLLKVHYSPRCRSNENSIYSFGRHETNHVICNVDANPDNVTFVWAIKKSSENAEEVKMFESNGTQSNATFAPGTVLGYDEILCWASNSVGTQTTPCTFPIVPPGPPESPKHCAIANRTSECLIVQCDPGNDGGLAQEFHLEIFNMEANGLEANITHSGIPSFNVCSLPMETTYILIIYSANEKGRSKSVVLQPSTVLTRTAKGEDDTISINQILGIIAGIISVFVLTLSAVVISKMLFNRRADDRDDRSEMEKPRPQLMNELKVSKLGSAQGPDIIPENTFYQSISGKPAVIMIEDKETMPKMREDPPSYSSRHQATQYVPEDDIVLSEYIQTPRKLRASSEAIREKETEESSMAVETPLVNHVQLNVTNLEEKYKKYGMLSTPV